MARSSLAPILISAGILLAGNGLQVTLVAVRANQEGFSAALIGLLGTAYYVGFIAGCFLSAGLIRRAGHIRVFASLAALAAVAALCLVLVVDPWVWTILRGLTGFCFSGLAMVLESWLNEKAGASDRGRVLSIYRVVDLGAVLGSQMLLPIFGSGGFQVFAVVAIFFCLAVVPMSLSRHEGPAVPESRRLRLSNIWRISPVGCVGCFTIGLTNAAFRTVGPVFAQEVGLGVDQIAIFIGAGVLGGALAQYPLGVLSDRIDRRLVLILATGGAASAGVLLSLFARVDPTLVYLGAFLFGAFAMPLYSLSIAHANDFAKSANYVELSAGLILCFGLGASIGPFVASVVMMGLGTPAFFLYTTSVHSLFIVFVVYRMRRRSAVAREMKSRFVSLLRTSPAIFRLARRNTNGDSR